MAIRRTPDGRKRSVAWIYYSIITIVLLAGGFAGIAAGFAFALVTAAYTYYLFRGGRFVLWIW